MSRLSSVEPSRGRAMMWRLAAVLLLAGSGLALSGCVVAPAGPGYYSRHYSHGYGYGLRHHHRPHLYYRPYW